MPEKPRLRMEINNIASLFTLFISHFFLSLLTLDYWINVLEDQPHTLRSTYIYIRHTTTCCKTSFTRLQTLLTNCFFESESQLYLRQVVQTGIIAQIKSKALSKMASIIKGKQPKMMRMSSYISPALIRTSLSNQLSENNYH